MGWPSLMMAQSTALRAATSALVDLIRVGRRFMRLAT